MKKLVVILLFILCSCTSMSYSPALMRSDIEGPPEYQAGWKDGCESGLATYGTAINKMFHTYYQNYDMLKDPAYSAGWHESFDYCRHYNLKYNTHDWTKD